MSPAADVDPDTQIAILAALLEPATYPVTELAQALRDSAGNVAAAAESLLLPRVKSAGKRKAGTSLESWLGKKRGERGAATQGANARQKDEKRAVKLETQAREDQAKEEVVSWGRAREDNEKSNRHRVAGKFTNPCIDSHNKDGLQSTLSALPPPLQTPSSPKISSPSRQPASKPAKNAFHLLQPPSPSSIPKRKSAPMPAVPLATQSAIDAHSLPLTLLKSPLSPAFASALFLALMEESEEWGRHRWFLAGRWVESPHTSANYYRLGGGYGDQGAGASGGGAPQEDGGKRNVLAGNQGKADGSAASKKDTGASNGVKDGATPGKYYYSGSELFPPKPYPDLLRQAAELIEPVVNRSLRSHSRHPLEWAGEWRANVCGANRYDGAAIGVGWHADQLSYLGPAATICSLSLGTTRAFRVRQTEAIEPPSGSQSSAATLTSPAPISTKPIRTYEVDLGHNSLILMNAGCQERYKHTIPPQKALDLFRPTFDIDQCPIPSSDQRTYTARINITFRFYRHDFHPSPADGWRGGREGTPYCRCGIPTLLRADQKAKARANMAQSISDNIQGANSEGNAHSGPEAVVDAQIKAATWLAKHEPTYDFAQAMSETTVKADDMVYFWQCQSPGNTGELKGCGFFRILDMAAEGRGPCWGDVVKLRAI